MQLPTEQCRSDLERFGLTQCAECGDLLHQSEVIVAVYYRDNWQEQEHFCSEDCKHAWRMTQMKREGM